MKAWNSGVSPFGVPLYFNPTSLIWLVFFMSYGMGTAIGMFIVLMLSLIIHEYGHVLVGRRMGFGTSHVETHMFGAAAYITSPMENHPHSELLTAIAGPITSAILGLICLPFVYLGGPWPLVWACQLNFILAVFNILPIFPMDGGRVLRSLISTKKGVRKATEIATIVTFVMASILGGLSLFMGDFWILMIMGMIAWMAVAERRRVRELFPEQPKPVTPDKDIWMN